jgi:tripartite-type tricarboxylate transporter receptor subunit TctC
MINKLLRAPPAGGDPGRLATGRRRRAWLALSIVVSAPLVVVVPAGVPAPVLERLNAEVAKAVRAPDLKDFFAERGFVVEAKSLDESRRFHEAEVAKWTRIVKAVNPQVN